MVLSKLVMSFSCDIFLLTVSNGEVQLWCTEKYEIYDVVYLQEEVGNPQNCPSVDIMQL